MLWLSRRYLRPFFFLFIQRVKLEDKVDLDNVDWTALLDAVTFDAESLHVPNCGDPEAS